MTKISEGEEKLQAEIASLKEQIEKLESEKAELVKAGDGVSDLQKKLNEAEAEARVYQAVIGHYEKDFDLEETLDRVAFNRKGEIIGYAPKDGSSAKGDKTGDEGQAAEGKESDPKDGTEAKTDPTESKEKEPSSPSVLTQLYKKHSEPAAESKPKDISKMSDDEILEQYEQQLKDEVAV